MYIQKVIDHANRKTPITGAFAMFDDTKGYGITMVRLCGITMDKPPLRETFRPIP